MGVELDIATRWGRPAVYVKMWSGKEVELAHAPPGIRGVVAIVFALSSEMRLILIENPEAHLHPSSQRLLTRIIAEAVNRGKFIIISTAITS